MPMAVGYILSVGYNVAAQHTMDGERTLTMRETTRLFWSSDGR